METKDNAGSLKVSGCTESLARAYRYAVDSYKLLWDAVGSQSGGSVEAFKDYVSDAQESYVKYTHAIEDVLTYSLAEDLRDGGAVSL